MKIREGFLLREVAGNYIVIAAGDEGLNFNNIITVNEIGAIIWRGIEAEKTKEQIIDEILLEYDIDKDTAAGDFDEFIAQLTDAGVIGICE